MENNHGGRSERVRTANLLLELANTSFFLIEDGKEMKLDIEKMKIKEIQTEVDRHSRVLRRAEDLSGN